MRAGFPIFVALVLAQVAGATTTGAVTAGAIRDDTVNPVAVRWLATGGAALVAKKPAEAIDAFEAALVVDPKNPAGFIGIARAYEAQALPGKAIRYYREALALQPNNLDALAAQGEALVARGASTRAWVNLDRIKTLCKGDCPSAKRLEIALAAPPPKVTLPTPLASSEPTRPVVTKN